MPTFHSNSPAYFFSNEKLSGAFAFLKLKNRKILTVAASGDPVLEALAQGATEIVGVDISKKAIAHTHLKIAGIQELSFSEYWRFFAENTFDYGTYRALKKAIPEEHQKWYDELFEFHGYQGYKIPRDQSVFSKVPLYPSRNLEHLADEVSYLKTKNAIKSVPITIRHGDLLRPITEEQFDVIFLSNLADYIEQYLPDPTLFHEVVKKYVQSLKPAGTLCVNYIRRADNDFYMRNGPVIKKESFRSHVLNIPGTYSEEVLFNGYFPGSQDMLVLLHKTA